MPDDLDKIISSMPNLKQNYKYGGKKGGEPFPEDFVFRQNEYRSEDLEVEERALMNIMA